MWSVLDVRTLLGPQKRKGNAFKPIAKQGNNPVNQREYLSPEAMGACTSRKIKFVPNDDIEGQVLMPHRIMMSSSH